MDEEDLADAEEAKRLETKDAFSGLGSIQDDQSRRSAVMDLFKDSENTKGTQLLRRMGWRDGQGVGPKIRRKARLADGGDSLDQRGETYLFAPNDSPMITLARKDDTKGLGFQGESRLDGRALAGNRTPSHAEDSAVKESSSLVPFPAIKPAASRRGAFGVGILNDNGSDDEDQYALGPKITYNRTLGSDKKKRKGGAKPVQARAEHSTQPRPVIFARRADKTGSTLGKCHDGRLPLNGFVLTSKSSSIPIQVIYPPQDVPTSWKPSKAHADQAPLDTAGYRSSTDLAKASSHDPLSRSLALGETPLPGQSVFDFVTPNARSRIVNLTKNETLPSAGWEKRATAPNNTLVTVPALDAQVAATALGRGTAGFIPYSDNPEKLSRYREFLSFRAGLTSDPPMAPSQMRREDWQRELQEFAHAATIFKPMTGSMASRFTSSNQAGTASFRTAEEKENLLSRPEQKILDPAEEAAKLGAFGPMTRASVQFYPSRLLCKRFNVPVPAHVTAENEGSDAHISAQAKHSAGDPQSGVGEGAPDFGSRFKSSGFQAGSGNGTELLDKRDMEALAKEAGLEVENGIEKTHLDPDRNGALEGERPGDDVFRAIFGSDSEEE